MRRKTKISDLDYENMYSLIKEFEDYLIRKAKLYAISFLASDFAAFLIYQIAYSVSKDFQDNVTLSFIFILSFCISLFMVLWNFVHFFSNVFTFVRSFWRMPYCKSKCYSKHQKLKNPCAVDFKVGDMILLYKPLLLKKIIVGKILTEDY